MFFYCGICEKAISGACHEQYAREEASNPPEDTSDNVKIDFVEEYKTGSEHPVCGLPINSPLPADDGEGVRAFRSVANPAERRPRRSRRRAGRDPESDDGECVVQVNATPPVVLKSSPVVVPDHSPTMSNPDVALEDNPQVLPPSSIHDGDALGDDSSGRRDGKSRAAAAGAASRPPRSKKAPMDECAAAKATSPVTAAPHSSRSSRSQAQAAPHSARSSSSASGATTARSTVGSSDGAARRRSKGKDAAPLPPNVHLRPAVSFGVQPVAEASPDGAPELEAFLSPEGGALKITKMGEAFEKWNAGHRYREVRVGDFIVEVGHERGTPEELRVRLEQAMATPGSAVDIFIKRVVGHAAPLASEKPPAKTLLQRLSSYGGSSMKNLNSNDKKSNEKRSLSASPRVPQATAKSALISGSPVALRTAQC